MLHWVESQSILMIAFLVFGFCYLLTIATFGAAAILSRRAVAHSRAPTFATIFCAIGEP